MGKGGSGIERGRRLQCRKARRRMAAPSAAIYARVSSAGQKKDQTIGSQTAALREHARANRLEVPAEWVFEDRRYADDGATIAELTRWRKGYKNVHVFTFA
jgi:predicted site-specific integrase-resolvase